MQWIGGQGFIDREGFLDQNHAAILVEEDRPDRVIRKIGIKDSRSKRAEVVAVLPAFFAKQSPLLVGLTLKRGGWRPQKGTYLLATHPRFDLTESRASLWLTAGDQEERNEGAHEDGRCTCQCHEATEYRIHLVPERHIAQTEGLGVENPTAESYPSCLPEEFSMTTL